MYSASHGDIFNCPAEVAEARYGLVVEKRSLSDEPGGSGHHQGGRGLSSRYRVQAEATLSAGFSRTRHPVWGLEGGGTGGRNAIAVLRPDGSMERWAMASGVALMPGDRVAIETAGGGGWGTS